jgi:energy-coupling factor transporter ATP-binding protein EcfA2
VRYADLADRILSSPPGLGPVRLVTVDGHAGSGKSSLANRLSGKLRRAPIVHMDHLYEGWDGLAGVGSRLDAWVLLPLRSSLPGRHLVYDWHRNAYREWREVPLAPVLIVEGSGAGQRLVDPWVTCRIWAECDARVASERALEREGPGQADNLEAWGRQEVAHFATERSRERADLIVDTRPNLEVDRDEELVLAQPTRWVSRR